MYSLCPPNRGRILPRLWQGEFPQFGSLSTTNIIINSTISTPGRNSWLWTLRISTIVSPWTNMSICQSPYFQYLNKSSINMSWPTLRKMSGYISKFKSEYLAWSRQVKSPTTAWKNIWEIWLWTNSPYSYAVETRLPWHHLHPCGGWFWVNCTNSQDVEHFRNSLQILYLVTTDWKGSKQLILTLKW